MTELATQLSALHDDYTYRINMLLDEGREDLARELSDIYDQDAAALIAQHGIAA